ncbi:MAG: hypothetical protein K0R48_405 [Gammaproteobacteria bacterium]|jgi:protein required for attachment to host cells|nr:hypothetical protein [Gammaproteobacteria bacterium]
MKKTTLLLIANATQAKIYEVTPHEYGFIQQLEHAESRLKTKDLTRDKPGHYQTSHKSQGQFISPTDAHEEEHTQFARVIADAIKKIMEKKHYQHIILCAEPHFYGLLNQFLSKSLVHLITKVVKKDYIPLPDIELEKVIEDLIHEHF